MSQPLPNYGGGGMKIKQLQKLKRLTNITVFHFSDVRPQPAVSGRQSRCEFVMALIQHDCKQREIVVLHCIRQQPQSQAET